MLRQYDPSKVSFSFQGSDIVGFMDGTFLDAERSADGWTKHVGALGDVTRTRNLDRTGKVTLHLMAQAPSNDILNLYAAEDEEDADQVGELMIRDASGNMLCHAKQAWIMKQPKVERAKEAGAVVWVFECADIEIQAAGNDTGP